MSLTADFEKRLDAHLATLNDVAKPIFLRSQLETWQQRYRSFCVRPRPSDPGRPQPTATDFLLTIGAVQRRLATVEVRHG